MRITLSLAVVATALFLPGIAHGLEGEWVVLSEGATTCGEFIAEPGMQTSRMEWILGYISGRNREATSPHDRFIGRSFQQPATVIGWLQGYCRLHSLDTSESRGRSPCRFPEPRRTLIFNNRRYVAKYGTTSALFPALLGGGVVGAGFDPALACGGFLAFPERGIGL